MFTTKSTCEDDCGSDENEAAQSLTKSACKLLRPENVVQALHGGTTLFENELFAVRRSPIGGLGAFAKRQLRIGDIILVEQPLFMSDDMSLFDDFKRLDRGTQNTALSLHKNELLRRGTPILKAIWSTNKFVPPSFPPLVGTTYSTEADFYQLLKFCHEIQHVRSFRHCRPLQPRMPPWSQHRLSL